MDMSLIAGMPKVIAYIKSQDERIKKLKDEIEEWEEVASEYWVETPSQLATWMSASIHEDDEVYSKYMEPLELRDENEKLKARLEEASHHAEAWEDSFNDVKEELEELKEELEELKEDTHLEEENEKLKECLKGYWSDGKLGDTDSWTTPDSWREELEKYDKYDGDDWAWGYGFTVKNGEYRINMAGGGDHWEDYVIKKDGCFIHNKDGMKKVRTFISCPEGNYLKVVELGDPDYELDEGETDMFEMVKECFIEDIMEYEEDA